MAALAAIAEAYPDADDATRERLLELAEAAVASLERLLEGAATESLRLERLDLGLLAEAAAETAALGGAPVVAKADHGLEVDGDPDRLRQALDNLIANAIGHSPPGGTVTVTARRVAEGVAVEVTDEGEGIEPADLGRSSSPGFDSRPLVPARESASPSSARSRGRTGERSRWSRARAGARRSGSCCRALPAHGDAELALQLTGPRRNTRAHVGRLEHDGLAGVGKHL